MITSKHGEYLKAAIGAGLHYVTDGFAGISRRRAGKGWSYYDADGTRIGDTVTRKRKDRKFNRTSQTKLNQRSRFSPQKP
jgi:DNA topoisomerase IB